MRELGKRLEGIGERLECLSAILVTHEHSDHVMGLTPICRRHHIPVYMTCGTATRIDWNGCGAALETFQAGARLAIGDVEIASFTIPHDAEDPVGFRFEAQGVRIGYATDLGYVPESIKYHLRRTHVLLLESNHDLEMLKVGPYPWPVKQRVMSRKGHLSNDGMCNFLLDDLDSSTVNLVLGHLSEQNNHPEIVRLVASGALERRGLATRLEIASQKRPTEVFQF